MKINFTFKLLFAIFSTHLKNKINFDTHSDKLNKIPNLANNGPLSFIETQEKVSLENSLSHTEVLKLESSLKEMFLKQMNERKRKRYTRSGKRCASAFVQDKITYYDCTNSKSPDGKNKRLEWCYIDIHSRDGKGKDWGYCKPIIDYDKVREDNQSELVRITTECRKTNDDLQSHISSGAEALKDLKAIRSGHADMDNKIGIMKRGISTMFNNLQYLEDTSKKWEEGEREAITIAEKIKSEQTKLEKEMNEKNQAAMIKTDNATIKKEERKSGMTINSRFMTREKSTKISCEGMHGYSQEKEGDGLIGEYFDNEGWIGSSVQRVDEKIKFIWNSISPIKGVNPHNYSIRWTSFVKAPYTGNYQFHLSTDDGAMLTLNNKIIIAHNMQSAAKESIKRNDVWFDNEVKKIGHFKATIESTSHKIQLIGGNKYKIVLSYFHSIQSLLNKEFKAQIELSWSSDEFNKEIIPMKYLYTQNEFPSLLPHDFDQKEAVLSRLQNNDLAFKDSIRYVLTDIPNEYLGLMSLKFNHRYNHDSFSLTINSPTIVYVAVLSHYPLPLSDEFEYMGQFFSILDINEKSKVIDDKIMAQQSAILIIYKRRFNTGRVNIPLKRIGANKKGVPIVIFLGPDDSGAVPISCGGKETLLSKPGTKYYKKCNASTLYNSSTKCDDAFRGKLQDSFGSMWYSKAQGIGAWLKITFKGLYMITKFSVKPRSNPAERNKQIELEFSDGAKQKFVMINTDKVQDFDVEKVQTQYIIIRVTKVFGTINNGGSFNFYGIECKNLETKTKDEAKGTNGLIKAAGLQPNKIPPLFNVETEPILRLSCQESVSNSKQFKQVKKAFGQRVLIQCYSGCSITPYMIFGTGKYTKDSAICKAAFHNKTINSLGGKFYLNFQKGLIQYDQSQSNGIKSYSKTFSEITLTFEQAKEKDEIIVKEGSKVDLKNPDGNGFVSASIIEVKNTADGKQLSLQYGEGGSRKTLLVPYPNKQKVFPCGDKIEKLDCKKSRVTLNKYRPIKIRFMPKTYKQPGDYIPDYGGVYGSTGKPFGWSKDILNRVHYHPKTAKNSKEAIIETIAHFPPSPNSRYCKKEIPDTICDKIDWSVKAGEGKFVLKISIGDPTVNSKIDLSINGESVVSKIISKGKINTIEKVMESKEGYFTLSSNCLENCDFSMAKINAIQIVPYVNKPKVNDPEKLKKEVEICGATLTQGKCLVGKDVLHCLFEKANAFTTNCTGDYVLMEIPKESPCKEQIGKFKCVKKVYRNSVECKKYCPKKCKKTYCA